MTTQVRTKSKEYQTQRTWGKSKNGHRRQSQENKTKAGNMLLLKKAMLCTLTLQPQVRSVSKKGFSGDRS